MKKIKGYRNIFERNRILGLEFMDLLMLLIAYLLTFLFSKNLIVNLIILAGVYFVLRLYKKGKPRHWSQSIVRFFVTRQTYRTDREVDFNE